MHAEVFLEWQRETAVLARAVASTSAAGTGLKRTNVPLQRAYTCTVNALEAPIHSSY